MEIDVRYVAHLARLSHLDLSNNNLTGAGLAKMEGLKSLQSLNLSLNAKLKDKYLAGLRNFPEASSNASRWLAPSCSVQSWFLPTSQPVISIRRPPSTSSTG